MSKHRRKKSVKLSTSQAVAIFIVIVILIAALALVYFFVVKPALGKNGGQGSTLEPAEGDLVVHFIDVGQGDCIFIQFPDEKTMIIDGGDNRATSEADIVEYIKVQLKITTIDYMVLTHTDADHVGGLDVVLSEFVVRSVYRPNISTTAITTKVYAAFMSAVSSEEGIVDNITKDDSDIVADTYIMDFYAMESMYAEIKASSSAEKKNGVSPLMFLTYAGKKVCFTGDANEEYTETAFLSRSLDFSRFDVDVLKVGHHGSESSSGREFLDVLKPEYAVFQCGDGNKYLHPRQAAIDRIIATTEKDNIYRNDLNGNIMLTITDTGEIKFTTDSTATADDKAVGADSLSTAALFMDGLYLSMQKMTIFQVGI